MSQFFSRKGTSERAEAHRILDLARAGYAITDEQINWALMVTGDLT